MTSAAYLTSLGLALWEHDGEQWLIPLDDDARHIVRVMRVSARLFDYALNDPNGDPFDRALASYLAAQAPPAQPKPGEWWLLGMDLGSVEQPVEVVEIGGELHFAWQDGGELPMLVRVADRHPSTYRRAES